MNTPVIKPASKQLGLSLVELMVAIVVSLLLLGGVIQIFINNKQTYRVQEAISRLQENGRFAMQFLTKDVRMSDFWGCAGAASSVTDHLDPASGSPPVDPTAGGIDGTNDAGLNGSDTIVLQGAFGSGLTILSHNQTAASFDLNTVDHGLVDGDVVLATDCEKADQFMISNANSGSTTTAVGNTGVTHGGLTNLTKPGLTYEEGDIFKVYNYSYSIKAGASGEPALFRSENGTDVELVEGIYDMQIKYGEDTDADGTANIYRDAGTAGMIMDNVVSVRITLTVRTIDDNVALSTNSSPLPSDKRIYRTFTSTVTIRNRVS